MSVKQPGLCTLCNIEVFEIVERFPMDHPLEGEVRRVGQMLENGTQIELLLSDNSEMALSFCLDCAKGLTPEQYPQIMARVREAWERELDDTHRAAIGAGPWPEHRMSRQQYRKTFFTKWIMGRLWARMFQWAMEQPCQCSRDLVGQARVG